MIPDDQITINVKLNAKAFAHILSLAKDSLNWKRNVVNNCEASSNRFDRTIDAIHANNLRKDYDFYDNLISKLQCSLQENGIYDN